MVKHFNEKTLRPSSDGQSKVTITFSEFITNNFLLREIKSLMLSPYLSLKDKGGKGTAQLLYSMLDYELSSKKTFHISFINLANRLGVRSYNYKSQRKQKMEPIIRSVAGKEILSGTSLVRSKIYQNEDKSDWIALFEKFEPKT